MTDIQKNTLRKLHDAFEKNDKVLIKKINGILNIPNDLTGVLSDKFDELGDTPVSEASLADALENGGVFGFAKALCTRCDIKSKDFDTVEFASFINKSKDKVTSFTNEDGTYKSTPNTENAKLPTFDDLEYISETSVNIRQLANDVRNGASEKVNAEFMKAQEDQMEYIYKLTGVDSSVLIDWEKSLLREHIIMYSANAVNTVTGRSL